jgi:hypothetical protein
VVSEAGVAAVVLAIGEVEVPAVELGVATAGLDGAPPADGVAGSLAHAVRDPSRRNGAARAATRRGGVGIARD